MVQWVCPRTGDHVHVALDRSYARPAAVPGAFPALRAGVAPRPAAGPERRPGAGGGVGGAARRARRLLRRPAVGRALRPGLLAVAGAGGWAWLRTPSAVG